MSQGIATIWERVLERDRVLKKFLSDASVVGSDPETDDPNDDPETEADDPSAELDDDELDPEAKELLAQIINYDTTISVDESGDDEPETGIDDDEPDPDEAEDVVNEFEESADLWLSRSHRTLEDVILSMGLALDVFPTNRPLLIFGSHRSNLTAPAYYRVELTRKGWPRRLSATEPLTGTDAAKILARSHPSSFEGETVAAEVPNSLLPRKRWIVLWPELKVLPESKSHQWRQVRRVVWCVNRKRIGTRDVIDWLSKFWQDIPIRIALFGARSFVEEETDEVKRSKMLPNVHRSLEKFDAIKSHPWVVIGP